jgi:hypothetical protein
MNGTVIDIPGISVSVTPHELQHSTDVCYTVDLVDRLGNKVKITVAFGKITEVTKDILK